MLLRTAGAHSRNASPLSPVFLKREPDQIRFMRTGQKAIRVLGVPPNMMSPTASKSAPGSPPRAMFIEKAGSKRPLGARAHRAPGAQIDGPKLPVIASQAPKSAADGPFKIPRKRRPAALPLGQAKRTEALPLSPFRYGMLRAENTPVLSPVPAVSPMSPITSGKIEQSKMEKLQKLEQLAQCASEGIPQEILYPSFGQVEEKAEQISSFLDLYRMRLDDDTYSPLGPACVQSAYADNDDEVSKLISARAAKTHRMSRLSQSSSRGSTLTLKRRSRSAGDYYSFADALEMESPRFSTSVHQRFSRRLSTAAASAAVPTSAHPYALASSVSVRSQYSQTSASAQSDVGVFAPSPAEAGPASSPRSALSRRATFSIMGADAKLIAQFRSGFGTRPLDFPLPPLPPPPMHRLPSPPVSPRLEQVKSPRVPYWVKSSFRPRNSAQALHAQEVHVQAAQPVRRRSNSKRGRELSPQTLRFERRMGWGGRWDQGNLAGVIESLRAL